GGYLWRVAANGGQPERLTAIPGVYHCPAWSPDGHSIAVVRRQPKLVPRGSSSEIWQLGQLEVVSIAEKSTQTIDNSVPFFNSLAFSPDSRWVIYTPQRNEAENSNSICAQLVSRSLTGDSLLVLATGVESTHFDQKMISP